MQDAHSYKKDTTIREIVVQYTRFWYLFILGAFIALVVAYVYLRYSTPTYLSKTTILIKDEKSGDGAEELAAFSGLGGFLSRFQKNKIENEIAIFKSKRIIRKAVEALKLNVLYESLGTIKTTEIYKYKPFTVNYLAFDDTLKRVPSLHFKILDNASFQLSEHPNGTEQTYNFGEKIELPFGAITVVPDLEHPEKFNTFLSKDILVSYRDVGKITSTYQKQLAVVNEIPSSNVVVLSVNTPEKNRAEDFLDELVFQYNKDAINDRSQVAKKTSDFIDSRLEIITRELDSVEANKENFKSNNRLTNIEAQAQLVLENASDFQKRQFNVNTQLELANTMIDYMEHSSSNDLLPANIGIEGEGISQSVSNYNELILQRNRLLKSSTSKNPVVVNLNNQINDIRGQILGSLKSTTDALKLSLRDLNYQESTLNSKLSRVPTQERVYRGIERQQTIKEQLYLFLLQQREEASISLAVTAPKAKVVDSAYSSDVPVSPKRPIIFSGAFLVGLLIPFLFLYLRQLLNDKVVNRKDVEQMLPSVSLIGEIPRLRKDDEHLIKMNDRSVLAESFRILRTNLQYLFINKLDKSHKTNTVFVTSTIKGEGKTFVAFNLALTIALTGKKVVLVGADIRNPQLHRYLSKEHHDKKGLTEFIIDPSLKIADIAAKSAENENLSIVLSGTIPPNPAELLMEERTRVFFEELREKYDYVVVDTAPSMLVTDTILINKLADVTLYVFKAGYTEKRLLDFVKDAVEDGRLSNVAGVLNSVSMSNFGYGNKYGYSYHQEKSSLKQRLFKK
ncbi:MAG TPA: polysaccharide biosynthesis tyrosine autokinase [Flavobacteriaceae bacterium]|nr:polysaccharide biosynthesis tyrosine autokinase [Flavobacteriaceae bacterium]MCB9213474.1 polysaccharide biosynthesis tyrosine autokinase [Alteromonas sp.]HPF12223.1 polysaccharide biosynthesis tyrosine autokinase [Flavobacteriaceae bacterium]HQU21990.1 polysaccharide biosynthesis tyrosine autokinase [Flavobacteriaceae bacterium]HQU65889.1 polysaccharide biosynthesis tyrosine autokinase [Flavobacteriaceae bacterium]